MPTALSFALCLALSLALSPLRGAEEALAPDFKVQDASGATWTLADSYQKPMLVDLWATWCGPCIKAMPDLNRLHEAYGEKLTVLGLSVDMQGWAVVKPMIKRQALKYPIALAPVGFSKAIGAGKYPFLVLLHKGKVVKRFKERQSFNDLQRELKPWL